MTRKKTIAAAFAVTLVAPLAPSAVLADRDPTSPTSQITAGLDIANERLLTCFDPAMPDTDKTQ